MSEHVHQWKRWPVVDLGLDYSCAECGEPERIVWAAEYAGKDISDMDDLLAEKRGGVFAGEMTAPAFICPCCGMVSHNPDDLDDLEHGYCGRCNWWTADPVLGPPHLAEECAARKS